MKGSKELESGCFCGRWQFLMLGLLEQFGILKRMYYMTKTDFFLMQGKYQ